MRHLLSKHIQNKTVIKKGLYLEITEWVKRDQFVWRTPLVRMISRLECTYFFSHIELSLPAALTKGVDFRFISPIL